MAHRPESTALTRWGAIAYASGGLGDPSRLNEPSALRRSCMHLSDVRAQRVPRASLGILGRVQPKGRGSEAAASFSSDQRSARGLGQPEGPTPREETREVLDSPQGGKRF